MKRGMFDSKDPTTKLKNDFLRKNDTFFNFIYRRARQPFTNAGSAGKGEKKLFYG